MVVNVLKKQTKTPPWGNTISSLGNKTQSLEEN